MEWGMNKTRTVAWLERYLASGAPETLRGCVSPVVRRWPRLPWRSTYLEVQVYPDAVAYRQVHGALKEPIAFTEAGTSQLPVVLIIAKDRVLHRELSVPAMASRDLAAVLANEVSRHTPYTAEQVSYTWRTREPLPGSALRSLDFWVLPLSEWQRLVGLTGIDAPRIRQVDVADGHGLVGVNLLPKPEQARYWAPHAKRAGLFGAVGMVLAAIALFQILQNRQADVLKWQAEVAALEQEARPVQLLKTTLTRKADMQQLLAGLKRKSPSRLQVLDELTRCLPADTVLDRLSITANAVAMDGIAKSPEAIIPALGCATTLRAPRLIGTLQADVSGQRQRFSLTADLADRRLP